MMPKVKQVPFQVFRYQILPISQTLQLSLFPEGPQNLEDLKAKKNEYFASQVVQMDKFVYPYTELAHRLLGQYGNMIVLLLGVNRNITRSTRDFRKELIDNWPTILVVMDNSPTSQCVAIQTAKSVFQNPITVANILEDNINRGLLKRNLKAYFEPTFEVNEFWDLVEKFKGKIQQTTFELISPNLANISGALELDLAALHKSSNTHKTNLELNSPQTSALQISKDDSIINSLVDYSAKGGGNITLKAAGYRRKISTKSSVKEISMDEITLQASDAQTIAEIFKGLLS